MIVKTKEQFISDFGEERFKRIFNNYHDEEYLTEHFFGKNLSDLDCQSDGIYSFIKYPNKLHGNNVESTLYVYSYMLIEKSISDKYYKTIPKDGFKIKKIYRYNLIDNNVPTEDEDDLAYAEFKIDNSSSYGISNNITGNCQTGSISYLISILDYVVCTLKIEDKELAAKMILTILQKTNIDNTNGVFKKLLVYDIVANNNLYIEICKLLPNLFFNEYISTNGNKLFMGMIDLFRIK